MTGFLCTKSFLNRHISQSAFICSMAMVTVPMLDCIFGRPLLRRQIVGAALAAFGVWALEMGDDVTSFTSDDLASLIQPIVFGLGFWRMEAAMEKFPTEAGRLASGQLFMVFLVSLSFLLCWSPAGDDLMLQDACNVIPTIGDVVAWLSDPSILGMLIWTGLITTAFTIYMETLALKTLSAAETTLIFSTEPIFGAAFAAVVANECLSEGGWIGSALIIGGCVISGVDWSQHFRRRGEISEKKIE
jgi:drug/metabolite transporter (DMT)-like permease